MMSSPRPSALRGLAIDEPALPADLAERAARAAFAASPPSLPGPLEVWRLVATRVLIGGAATAAACVVIAVVATTSTSSPVSSTASRTASPTSVSSTDNALVAWWDGALASSALGASTAGLRGEGVQR